MPGVDIQVDISLQDPEWEKVGNIGNTIREAVKKAVSVALLPKELEGKELDVSIVLANDDLLQLLNNEYRGKNVPTNVLTFANIDDEEQMAGISGIRNFSLGDVLLSYQTIDREAREQGKFFVDHFVHMLVHGVLHMLGYDHEDDDDAALMEVTEIKILEGLDIQDPYTLRLVD